MTKRFYCSLCWQEFDNPSDHNKGSWYRGERLDADCPGDIRPTEGRPHINKTREAGPALQFSGDPIELK